MFYSMPQLTSTKIPKESVKTFCHELKSRDDVKAEEVRSPYEAFRGRFKDSPIIIYNSGKVSHYDNHEVIELIQPFCKPSMDLLTDIDQSKKEKQPVQCMDVKQIELEGNELTKLYSDGGARGNPGTAGFGFVLELPNGDILKGYQCIGIATNNEAEYHGLLAGLEIAKSQDITKLQVFLDAELIVLQLRGEYKVKSSRLQSLYTEVKKLLDRFTKVAIFHVRREENVIADSLANLAMDQQNQKLILLNE